MAVRLAAAVMGEFVWKTTSAVSPDFDGNRSCRYPDFAGNRSCRMLRACWDGVFPAVNLFSKCVPTIWATTVTPIMARIHMTRTVRRRS